MTSVAAQRQSPGEERVMQSTSARYHPVSFQKYTIQRLKPAIHKYQKVLQIDLDRLLRHRNNVDKFVITQDWVGLHQEQINASRTVQQVKATLCELDRVRSQVFDNEVRQFDKQVQEVKVQALTAVETFLQVNASQQPDTDNGNTPDDQADSRMFTSLPSNLATFASPHSTRHVVPDNTRAAASREQLQQDMMDLAESVQQFAIKVELKEEVIDSMDDTSLQSLETITEGTKSQSKISSYKMAVFPVVGALIGGAMAGPVGLYAGIKIGGLAGAVGGGVAGLAGGTIMKTQNKKCITPDMSKLAQKDEGITPSHSASTPELPSSTPATADSSTEQQHEDDDHEQSFLDQIFSWGQPSRAHSQSDE